MKRPRAPLARVLEELDEYSCHKLAADQDSREQLASMPGSADILVRIPVPLRAARTLRVEKVTSFAREIENADRMSALPAGGGNDPLNLRSKARSLRAR